MQLLCGQVYHKKTRDISFFVVFLCGDAVHSSSSTAFWPLYYYQSAIREKNPILFYLFIFKILLKSINSLPSIIRVIPVGLTYFPGRLMEANCLRWSIVHDFFRFCFWFCRSSLSACPCQLISTVVHSLEFSCSSEVGQNNVESPEQNKYNIV